MWNTGTPDTWYTRWYVVEATFSWKGKKPFKRQVFGKWNPTNKQWTGYNNRPLSVTRWMETDKIKEL